jgi:uncharacterized protein
MLEKINNVTKIGVISDTHIPTRAKFLPQPAVETLKGTDFIIHCGDVVSKEVLLELGLTSPVYAVKGNMDPDELDLPDERILLINSKLIICVAHGSGPPFDIKQRLFRKFKKYDPFMIIYGHTHVPENDTYNGILVFNPGSCTYGKSNNSIGILTVSNDMITGKIITL